MLILLLLRLRKTLENRPWQLVSFITLTSVYTFIALCTCGVSIHIYRSLNYLMIPTSSYPQVSPSDSDSLDTSFSHTSPEINPLLKELFPTHTSTSEILDYASVLGQTYYYAIITAWTILGFILLTLVFLRYRVQHYERIKFFSELNRYGYSSSLIIRISTLELTIYSWIGFTIGTGIFLILKEYFRSFKLLLLPLDLSVNWLIYVVSLGFLLVIDLGYSFHVNRRIKHRSILKRRRSLLIDTMIVFFVETVLIFVIVGAAPSEYFVNYFGGIVLLLAFVIFQIYLVKLLLVTEANIAIRFPWISLSIAGKQTLDNLSWSLHSISYAVISFYMIMAIIGFTTNDISVIDTSNANILVKVLLPDVLFSTAAICFLTLAISTIVFVVYLLVYLQRYQKIMREWLSLGWKISTLAKIIFWQVFFGATNYLVLVFILFFNQIEDSPHAHLQKYLLLGSIFTIALQFISTFIIAGVFLLRLHKESYPLESRQHPSASSSSASTRVNVEIKP